MWVDQPADPEFLVCEVTPSHETDSKNTPTKSVGSIQKQAVPDTMLINDIIEIHIGKKGFPSRLMGQDDYQPYFSIATTNATWLLQAEPRDTSQLWIDALSNRCARQCETTTDMLTDWASVCVYQDHVESKAVMSFDRKKGTCLFLCFDVCHMLL